MTISSSIGPVSGIDYGKLITGLTGIDQQPINDITTRLGVLDQQNTALLGLSALMTGLKISAANFSSAAVFRATTATSANPNVLTATGGIGAPVGNYSFNVQQLASASQQVTDGFSDSSTPLGITATIKLQLGGGALDSVAKLSSLNGGTGVSRGSIRITDRSGASTLVDLTHAVSVQDVADSITGATGVSVNAKIDGDKLVLTDTSGGAGNLVVTDAGGTTAATDLGLTNASVGATLTGSTLTGLKGTTSLDSLNDGLGVRTAGILKDFTITGSAGAASVSLSGAKSLADVITKINAATLDAGGTAAGITAAISSDGTGITLTDAGGGPITVTGVNGSLAANDLGIAGTSGGATLTGDRIATSLTGPLLKDLRGGYQAQAGELVPNPGTITINGQTIDLSNVKTLSDALKTINTNAQGVTASLNSSGNGITLSSAAASFTVADGTGNLASYLNIAGTSTATASGSAIQSGDERLQYVSNNTRLSTLNGGGVKGGTIRITAPSGGGGATTTALTLDLSAANTVGDVISRINASGLSLTARINDTGDGILLTQTAGTTQAKIEDVSGTLAHDLNISGVLSNNTLDGSLQDSINIVATDKLSDIATKLNAVNGVSASVINDGSGSDPFRLSITSRFTGSAGKIIFDGSAAGIATTSLVHAQDAVVILGGDSTGKGGLVASSTSNSISTLVPGLTVALTGVGTTAVSVTRDDSKVTSTVQGFVDSYNKVIANIADVTKFNADDPTKNGVLFGNSTVQQVQDALNGFITQAFGGVGAIKSLATIGISFDQSANLTFDTDQFAKELSSNPDDVRNFFTTNVKAVATDLTKTPPVLGSPAVKGVGAQLSDLLDRYTNAQTGLIFQSTDSITSQETQLKTRQAELTDLVAAKKNRLIQQFANLEVTISQLQSQGNAIANFKPVSTTSSSKSS